MNVRLHLQSQIQILVFEPRPLRERITLLVEGKVHLREERVEGGVLTGEQGDRGKRRARPVSWSAVLCCASLAGAVGSRSCAVAVCVLTLSSTDTALAMIDAAGERWWWCGEGAGQD